jgi:hypothetical protein
LDANNLIRAAHIRHFETLTRLLHQGTDDAFFLVIVNKSHRQHEGIDGGEPDEFQPCFFNAFESSCNLAETEAVCGAASSSAPGWNFQR